MNLNDFNWDSTIENWEKWWNGELGRPVFICYPELGNIEIQDAQVPYCHFTSHYDFSISAKDILKYMEKRFEKVLYYADTFPAFWPNFGPGALTSFIGGEGINHERTVWFNPGRFENCELKDISIKLDKNSEWFKRVEEFFIAAADLWHGKIQFGMTDLGGTLDVLSALRPGEKLLFDLYDFPDEVKRIVWEIHQVWHEVFDYFNGIIETENRGYSAWTPLLSKKRYYMLQCDFSYMLSPEMFEEFVKPELAASCRRIERPFYHLDGKGELPHLEHLCSIPELKGIQWIPGAGAPPACEWPEVLNKIVDSGKKLQVGFSEPADIEKIINTVSKPEAVAFIGIMKPEHKDSLTKLFEKYGAV